MKKPNITEGEWEYDKSGCQVLGNNRKNVVADVYEPFTMDYRINCNGKAISAVPEMIDALIAVNEFYETNTLPKTVDVRIGNSIRKVREALKKAGCEL